MVAELPMVPNDFARAVHHSLLRFTGVDGARAFWGLHPLVLDGVALDPLALVRFLENDQNRSPMSWYAELMNGLGPFLRRRELDVEAFAQSLLVHANRGSFVSARSLLLLAGPFLSLLYRVADPHRLFVRMSYLTSRTFLPELIFEELAWKGPGLKERRAVLAVGFAALWDGRIPAWDAPSFTAPLLREMPRSVGVEPYTSVETIADARTLESLVSPSRLSYRDDVCLVDAQPAGRRLSFDAYCASLAVSTRHLGTPDRQVVVLERACHPDGGGPPLRSGCGYGAPLFLFELHWRFEPKGIHSALHHIIHEALRGADSTEGPDLQALRRSYFGRAARPVKAVYLAVDQSIYLDDLYVARGVPAIILRNCLRAHTCSGRTEFAYREFKRDRELVSHPKNTGFEVRLRRLRERLDAAGAPVRIHTVGRGRFDLDLHAPLILEEHDVDHREDGLR